MNKQFLLTIFFCIYSIMSFAQIYNQAGSNIYFSKEDSIFFNGDDIINSGNIYIDSATIYTDASIINTGDTALIDNTESNIVLQGDSTQNIKMSGSSIHNLTINKSANSKAKINGNTTVNGNINMVKGFLAVENINDTLKLGSTATVTGESDSAYIRGNLEVSRVVNGNSSNFGGIGLTIDASANNVNLGSIIVTRIAGNNLPISSSGYTSIDRVWKIEPTIQPTDTISLTLQWLADNDNGVDISNANVWYTVDEGVTWQPYQRTFDASTTRTVTFGIDHFSYWTVGDIGLPFPINLLNLKATLLPNQKGLIEWTTSSEMNNDYFEVEKMESFNRFNVIGKAKGAGNSTQINNYSLIDNNVKIGTNYYRLKQIDFNGAFTYSDIVSLYKDNERIVLMYPNPSTTSVTINISEVSSISPAEITFINALGQEVSKITTIMNDNNINVSNLASGTYTVAINMKKKISYHKLVKE